MSKQVKPYLKHILTEAEYLLQNSKNLEFDKFMDDETLKRSFVRSLEVIGEATKNLPKGFRNKYPQIKWKEIAGLRDILIHQYFGINYISVWDIVKNKIPELKRQIENVLSGLDE